LADKRFPNDREIGLQAARGVHNGLLAWGILAEAASDWRQRYPAMGRIQSVFADLLGLAERSGNDREFGLVAAKGAVAVLAGQKLAVAADAGQRDLAIGRVNSVFSYLRRLADEHFPNGPEIVMEAAKGAVNTIGSSGYLAVAAECAGQRVAAIDLMDSAFAYLVGLTDMHFPNDREIGQWAASGAYNTVLDQGKLATAASESSQRDLAISRMDAALAYLRGLADERFRNDPEIGLIAAKSTVEAILVWEKLRRSVARTICRSWLRELRDRHFHPEISYLASRMNV
jgi:hypothetical protein